MPERNIDVFFYGLFMDVEFLKSQGLSPSHPRLAKVQDFDLVIGRRATLLPNPGAYVYGLVIGIPWNQVEQLYREESVSDYRPEAVLALLENQKPVAALCYNLPVIDDFPPNQLYTQRLFELTRALSFPQDHLNKIQKFLTDMKKV